MKSQWIFALGAGPALVLIAAPAQAIVVASSLPYQGTPDWTDIVFADAAMITTVPGQTTLSTYPGEGVWFGWGAWYGDQPAWTPASSSVGNYFAMTARFGANGFGDAADWSAYFYDQSHEVVLNFNPTGCADFCYGQPHQTGVEIYFGKTGDLSTPVSEFVAIDTSVDHRYEFLLRDGLVSYRIDGVAYSGQAITASIGAPLLVVGDGSGSTQSGVGTMTISSLAFDNQPDERVLLSGVPEPASWAMMIGGFALAGAAMRRRGQGAIASAG